MEKMDIQTQTQRYNAITMMASESLWGFQAAMVAPATFFAVLLKEYGAGQIMIGSLSALEGGGVLLTQIIGLFLFSSVRRRKRNLVMWHFALVVPFLFCMALTVFFGRGWPPWLVAWLVWSFLAAYMVGLGIVVAVWSEWTASLFPVTVRGRMMGLILFAYSLAGAAGALAAGRILSAKPGPAVYAICLLIAGSVAALSLIGYGRVRDPAETQPERLMPIEGRVIFARFLHSLRDSNFRYFLGGRLLMVFAFAIMPLATVHFSSAAGGGLDRGTLVSCGAALTVGLAAGNLGLGYLGDRFGHRMGILIGAAFQVKAILVLVLMPGLWGCIFFYCLAGVSNASSWVSHYNLLFETCPHDHLGAHITVGNLVLGIAAVTAPVLAGVAAERFGLMALFVVALAIAALALLWLLVLVREPRPRPAAVRANKDAI